MITPRSSYEKREKKYTLFNKKMDSISNTMSTLRLLIFILGIALSIYLYNLRFYYLVGSSVLITIILFLYIIYLHENLKSKKKYLNELININEKSIKRLSGEWKNFSDSGKEFIDQADNYSYDIDIFGDNSLFQFINTAITFRGRKNLSEMLRMNPKSLEQIFERQSSCIELTGRLSFRQKLIAEGELIGKVMLDPEELYKWAKEKNQFILKPIVIWFFTIMPLITISTCLIYLFKRSIPYSIPLSLLLFQFIIISFKVFYRENIFKMAELYCQDIKAYKNMLKLIEKQGFHSPYLKKLQSQLFNKESIGASKAIEKLSKLADAIASRKNVANALLNIIVFTDYHLLIRLVKWKVKYGEYIERWFEVVGEIEVYSSFGSLKYDNPNWAMPKIEKGEPYFKAINLGHPLLGDKKISNDVSVMEPRSVILITGSNMSGKSTLLRTLGVNLVLAYAGSPVCADNLSCSLMELYTCMRINDDLENNISSFYGEIIKIKRIVKAANDGKRVFFLLDEIFKGTNSIDRHAGAAILIEQLSMKKSIGLVSTHDLELGDLEKEAGSKVVNYHFEEYYKDDKIDFDYKLKKGISTTRNAVYLMRLAGININ